MLDLIKNCIEYSHLAPFMKTIEQGTLIDIIELKLELYCAVMENKYKGKLNTLDVQMVEYTEEEQRELETWGTAILLKDKIIQYKELLKTENKKNETLDDIKIEITKLLYEII